MLQRPIFVSLLYSIIVVSNHSSTSHIALCPMTLRLRYVYKCRCVSGGTSCSKAPAPLKRLEGFLEAKEREMRFVSRVFLRYDSSFAFLSGKAIVVDIGVQLLKLKRKDLHHYCTVYVHQGKRHSLVILSHQYILALDLYYCTFINKIIPIFTDFSWICEFLLFVPLKILQKTTLSLVKVEYNIIHSCEGLQVDILLVHKPEN